MQVEQELSPEAIKAIGLIEKLFRLAARNNNPEESASALKKANKLMEDFNLDQSTIEENSGESGKRADEKLRGGHYEFQRDLWHDVSELNFCLYMNITEVEPIFKMVKRPSGTGFKYTRVGEKRYRTHRIVGRMVNVKASKIMASYLEDAVERITAEHLGERLNAERLERSQLYSTYANSVRAGMVRKICEKIYDKRSHLMREERKRKEEAERQAAAGAMEGMSLNRAITVASFAESEDDANNEFVQPGYLAAKQAAAKEQAEWNAGAAERRAHRARVLAEQEAAYARWAERNPLEARLQEELARKEREKEEKREARNAARRTGPRQSYSDGFKGDRGGLRAGYALGERVSIDPQLDKASKKGRNLG